MHGMGDYANDPRGMVPLQEAISEYLDGAYVLNVQIGDTSIEDIMNGFFMNLDDQVDYFADVVKSDPNLVNGFNAVGYSQGNLVIRGYIEKYNDPPLYNFISVHGPMAGVGSFPGCAISHDVCKLFSQILGSLAYHPKVQEHQTQSNYFRNPMMIDKYLAGNTFLVEMNNEKSINADFASNWESLESVCLVKALADTVVIPNDSEWFGFFQDGTFEIVWVYNEAPWYSNDLFGLKSLDSSGRVFFNTTDGNHLDFETDYLLTLVGLYFE
jgi:palmitoyl-protein thioesterase